MFNTPVLFLIFNRPDLTQQVFSVIRQVKPKHLFIAADGPRIGKSGEQELCIETRELVLGMIDWDCEIKTLFRDENLGCKLAVSGAINWFFDNVEEGIILEDDCVPDISFFPFCEWLLNYHRTNEAIMHIAGNNFLRDKLKIEGSYYLSRYSHIWGWATWKRAWAKYDRDISFWPLIREGDFLNNFFGGNRVMSSYWTENFDITYQGKIDNWDAQWLLTCWYNKGGSIIPRSNLVRNIGFREDATHTKNTGLEALVPVVQPLYDFEHGNFDLPNDEADTLAFYHLFRPDLLQSESQYLSWLRRVKLFLRNNFHAIKNS